MMSSYTPEQSCSRASALCSQGTLLYSLRARGGSTAAACTSFFFINLENPISVLYSTKFHPQRNTFLPFPRPLWGTLAHPERTGAALDSSKANAPPWYFSAARLRGPSGETTKPRPTVICCEVADKISTTNYLEL